ncbi:MAG: hypothetical protein WDW38_002179 [Sanguina aurantia]
MSSHALVSTTKPCLLIIGGGVAGVQIALSCAAEYEVTLVDRKKYFEVTNATCRSCVDPDFAKGTVFAYSEFAAMGRVVTGSIVAMTAYTATLDSGEVFRFDNAVICTGTTYINTAMPWPNTNCAITKQERLEELLRSSEQFKAAKVITIVGGGPAGVEMAAEILEMFAGKSLTVIGHAGSLLPRMPARCGAHAKRWLEGHGAKVILGEGAKAGASPNSLVTSTGNQLQSDLVLMAVGGKVNSGFLEGGELGKTLNEAGRIKVSPSLQVPSFPHIFAVGDVNDVDEPKLTYLAQLQAKNTAKNLLGLVKPAPPKLKSYAPMGLGGGPLVGFVSLGRSDGAGRLNSCTCTGFFPVGMIKSKDLFSGKLASSLGLKVR